MQKIMKPKRKVTFPIKAKGNAHHTKKKIHVFTKKKKEKTPETNIIQQLREKYEAIDLSTVASFQDLPLSAATMKGLKKVGYNKPTDIQLQTLKYSLKGDDILGAAQTGSGKTLAFLIPVLEILFCSQWSRCDGVGALVITPTRELAYQIFEELKKIGEFHDFSAGLIIGGKDLKFERDRMDQCNIVICTPGRLLQHMDENPLFNCDQMQVLVLDEADRILDMGFAETINAIVANLPPVRQSLLFSATQTKSVKDLARLSLKDPRYVSVHEHNEFSTPSELKQHYTVCELHEKIAVLYSFIRNHLKSKIIIFFSSCKQTKYVFEIFSKLRPGMSLMALYGTLHQLRRMDIYQAFCQKQHAVLFATDLAARGLDFPQVNWVVQADCPEDAETYIHRVGRTARYHRGGESLLVLLPSETTMIAELEQNKIPIEHIDINPSKLANPVRKMEAYLAKDPQLKDTAQRAFKSYIKATHLMKNKQVFNVKLLDTEQFARSLGLAIAPRIRFLEKIARKDGLKVNMTKPLPPVPPVPPAPPTLPANTKTRFDESDQEEAAAPSKSNTTNTKLLLDDDSGRESSDDDADNMLVIKRANHDIDMPENAQELEITGRRKKPLTKAALARKMLNKQIVPNKRVLFGDDGQVILDSAKQKQSGLAQEYENDDENDGGINIEKAKLMLREEDQYDKQLFKEKVKAKKKEAKRKLKEQKKALKEDANVDEFGTDDEQEEEEEGSEPDLSWLPDPDMIYGSDADADDEQVQVDTDVSKTKPLAVTKQRDKDKKKCRSRKKIKLDDTAMNVNDAEELAMMLLRK